MGTDLSADGCAILSGRFRNLGEILTKSKGSLDEQPVIVCKVFHDGSFPAGYNGNCSGKEAIEKREVVTAQLQTPRFRNSKRIFMGWLP